jgi:hypothetical protein
MIIETAELEMPVSAFTTNKTPMTTQADLSDRFLPASEPPIVEFDMAGRPMVIQNAIVYFAFAGLSRFLIVVWLIPVVGCLEVRSPGYPVIVVIIDAVKIEFHPVISAGEQMSLSVNRYLPPGCIQGLYGVAIEFHFLYIAPV